jgi:hypothetical protein
MGGEIIQLLIGLAFAAWLLLLVPRRVSRAWAIWLLICLIAGSLQWVGLAVYTYDNQDRLYLSTKGNQLEFQKDQAGEVASVVVNRPPEHCRASRNYQQSMAIAGSSLALAFAVLLLLLRAEPAAALPETAATSAGRGIGISSQVFGLAILVASMAAAIAYRRSEVNVLGVAVIASGYYVSRGSRLAGKWVVAFMALHAVFYLFFVFLVGLAENVEGIGPSEVPWAIALLLAATAWAVVNLVLTVRFLRQTARAGAPRTSLSDDAAKK